MDPLVFLGPHGPEVIERQYMGTLADKDAKSLITRSYNTTKEEAAAVDRIIGHPHTLYISHQDFVRHAVWEMLRAYEEMGFPDNYLRDVTAHLRATREEAQRTRLRQEFADTLAIMETSLSTGLDTGDFDYIAATLATLAGYIDRTPEPHWKMYLRRQILKSGVVKAAVDALYEVGHQEPHFKKASERWQIWAEGLDE